MVGNKKETCLNNFCEFREGLNFYGKYLRTSCLGSVQYLEDLNLSQPLADEFRGFIGIVFSRLYRKDALIQLAEKRTQISLQEGRLRSLPSLLTTFMRDNIISQSEKFALERLFSTSSPTDDLDEQYYSNGWAHFGRGMNTAVNVITLAESWIRDQAKDQIDPAVRKLAEDAAKQLLENGSGQDTIALIDWYIEVLKEQADNPTKCKNYPYCSLQNNLKDFFILGALFARDVYKKLSLSATKLPKLRFT